MTACELRYEVSGPDAAPVVVLSGSLGTDASMWDPQSAALSHRFRVLRYDTRGHGSSPVPAGPYDISDLGGDLLALLDRLDIARASLCGLSLGGMVSMWVAANAPERVERLVLCCTAAYLGPEQSWRERAAIVRADGLEPIADGVIGRWFTEAFRRSKPEVVARARRMLVSTPAEGYAGCCEAVGTMDLRPQLPEIIAPALVIAGEDDPATRVEHADAIASGIGGPTEVHVVSHAAHLASVERAELVTALILKGLGVSR